MIIFVRVLLLANVLHCVNSRQLRTFAPITVTTTTTTLSQARLFLAATSSHELVFFAGGGLSKTEGPSDRIDIYNVTSGTWTTATLSVPRGGLGAADSENLVFFGGGTDTFNLTYKANYYDTVDIYNISDGSWSNATLSVPRAPVAATSVGNLVFFAGGRANSSDSNVVDIYNVTSNTWTNATLSQARYAIAAISVSNRYAIFAGGQVKGVIPQNTVDIYDSLNGTWWTANLSQARSYLAATSVGNLTFFGGGNATNQQISNVVDIFNSTTQTWSTTTLSQARYLLAAASIEDIVAFGGGTPDGFAASSTVDIYNTTSNIWFTVSLGQPRMALAATASSPKKILFGGGLSNTGPSNIVDIFDFNPISNVPLAAPTSSTTLPQSAIIAIVVGSVVTLFAVSIIILIVYLKRQHKKTIGVTTSQVAETATLDSEKRTILNEISKCKSLTMRSEISFKEIVVEKKIGEGSYGRMFLAKWNEAPVALKFCRNKGSVDDFISEIKIFIELPPHPNVVQMFGISLDGPQPVIVMEYCSGGSLDQLLFDKQGEQTITNERKIELVRGIARGALHLHKHNIVHRDLAARNILITSGGDPKIADFGMSRILEHTDEGKTKSGVGPLCWMAPESIATRIYSKKSDVWSFGIVVYEIVAQCEPHKNMNVLDVAVAIRDHGLTPKIPDNCPSLLREVMEMCWKKEPSERPTFEMICSFLASMQNVGVG